MQTLDLNAWMSWIKKHFYVYSPSRLHAQFALILGVDSDGRVHVSRCWGLPLIYSTFFQRAL